MKKYIDCDGVILDTETGLFDAYYEEKKKNPELRKRAYLENLDWHSWINQAQVLKDALEILRNFAPQEADIITKVHSLQEAKAKIEFFREHRVENNIIVVPALAGMEKSLVVSSHGNILVDDSNSNLADWSLHGGYPIYFGSKESTYPKIETLEEIFVPKLLEKKITPRNTQK